MKITGCQIWWMWRMGVNTPVWNPEYLFHGMKGSCMRSVGRCHAADTLQKTADDGVFSNWLLKLILNHKLYLSLFPVCFCSRLCSYYEFYTVFPVFIWLTFVFVGWRRMWIQLSSGLRLSVTLSNWLPIFRRVFYPEDGANRFLRNIGNWLAENTASRSEDLIIHYEHRENIRCRIISDK
jgi:hypothetical protein